MTPLIVALMLSWGNPCADEPPDWFQQFDCDELDTQGDVCHQLLDAVEEQALEVCPSDVRSNDEHRAHQF